MCLWPLPVRRSWPVYLFLIGALAVTNDAMPATWRETMSRWGRSTRLLWFALTAFIVIFLGRQFVENLTMLAEIGDLLPKVVATDVALKNLGLFVALCQMFLFSRRLEYRERWLPLIIGFGIYAFVNLVADRFMPARDNVFSSTRFEGREDRWMPYLVRSNALFSAECVVVSCIWIGWNLTMVRKIRVGAIPWIAAWVAVGVLLWAALRCEFRGNLVILGAMFMLVAVRAPRIRQLMMFAAILTVIGFPVIFYQGFGHRLIAALDIEKRLQSIGSSTASSSTLSNRTDLWEYGIERLGSAQILCLGEGPVLRDAQPAIDEFREGYRMSYHSAFLDLVVGNGIFAGGVILLLLVRLANSLCKAAVHAPRSSPVAEIVEPAILCVFLWCSTSFMDTGIGTYEALLLCIIPPLGGLAEVAVKGGVAKAAISKTSRWIGSAGLKTVLGSRGVPARAGALSGPTA